MSSAAAVTNRGASGHDEGGDIIFVCYAREDEQWVHALELEAVRVGTQQARFWIDRTGVHPSDDWTRQVNVAVSCASAAVLLISQSFLQSEAILKYELPLILARYHAGELVVVFVPVGPLDMEEVRAKLGLDEVQHIVSVPCWDTPLLVPRRLPDIRDKILSAASETPDVQNLRENIASKYRLERRLPDGTLGKVFLATDTQLQRKVCVKLLTHQELQGDLNTTLHKIANASLHTHVLTIYGAYLASDPIHLIRRYEDGVSLRAYLDEHQSGASNRLVQAFLSEIGDAVVHAHNKGVAGLSIKPTSILLAEADPGGQKSFLISLSCYPEEKLLDDHCWRVATKNAAPFYLPPEYRRGSREDSDAKKSDQYRLGVIAYEMLVGTRRFEQIAAPLRQRELDPAWHWPSLVMAGGIDCPKELLAAIDRMVRRNPDERYESLAAALRDIARDLQVETARDSYRRIMRTTESQEKFFRTFYVRFLTAYPGMRKLFRDLPPLEDSAANSEGWKRQFQKLKEAVLLLVVFSALREDQQEPNILTRVADSHTRLEVPADMYEKFAEMLVECIVTSDKCPEAPDEAELRRAWSRVFEPGVAYMRRRTIEHYEEKWRRDSAGFAATSSR